MDSKATKSQPANQACLKISQRIKLTNPEWSNAEAERITRQDVVSLASQIFDTQGFVSPYVMHYKKLLPLLWHNNTTWDENLIGKTTTDEQNNVVPDEVAREAVDRFKEWIKDVPRLKELRFSRYLSLIHI